MDSVFTKTCRWRRVLRMEFLRVPSVRPNSTVSWGRSFCGAQAHSTPWNGCWVAVAGIVLWAIVLGRRQWELEQVRNSRELTTHTDSQLFSWIYAYKLAASLWLISSIPTKLTTAFYSSCWWRSRLGPYYSIIPRVLLCLTIILK